MQNDEQKDNTDQNTEIKTVEIDQDSQTSAMTGPSLVENPQVPTSQSTFGLDVSCSDDDEVSEVDSFILDADDPDPVLEPSFLLPQSMEGATVTVDPETHARLEALLEAAGIGKLSTADGKALTDPEVLRKLTSSVSCALDEAAQALHRMRAEQQQQGQLGNIDSQRSLAEACSDGDVPTVRKLLNEGGSVHETTEEGDSLLSLACSAGYYELAQVLLAMKANVEDRGIKGDCTPLMEAASGGYVDIVKLLIAHGADVNAQSSAGNTPLHYAACGGYEDVVQVLIDAGANVEQHNENGHTPLMEAASAGHVGVAAILLHSGAGINTHSNEFKESALTLACYKGHLQMVKFLLEAGADQEHKTDEMHTALMEASMDGHVDVARLLLDSGAQVNMPADSFESPLTLAACGGHVELANLLIERGANLEEVNDEGYTPLMEAAREGHEEMVALLLAHDADINAQTEETQETALTLACCGGFLDVADFLISAGADIELGCSTPLMEAAQEGHLELVKYLLKANADVQATTGTGDTALTYACENGHTDVADVLLQHGAVLEHESEGGRTPLMKAARAGHRCTVQFLISKGAEVNRQTTTNDHTVLSLACAGGHLSVVEKLLENGADPTHKLKDGSTMVIEAAKGGHTQVVQLLLEYPNRMLMNSAPELPVLNANDSHLVESRVPIHGLANIVPPSEPDSHPSKPNNLTTTACEHSEGSVCKRKTQDKDMNIPIKAGDQIWQNMQKLAKKSTSTGNAHCLDLANKINKTSNLTIGDIPLSQNENGLSNDLLPDETIDFKAGERLEQIISNVMAKELISTASTREEQILRKQQILEELQKVERELQEKAQQQLLITAQQQQHQQLQQALQSTKQKVFQKQLEEQKKRLPVSSPAVTSSLTEVTETQVPNNLDKLASKVASGDGSSAAGKPGIKPNISGAGAANGSTKGSEEQIDGGLADKPAASSGKTSTTSSTGTNGQQVSNGSVQSHNGGTLSSQVTSPAIRHPLLPLSPPTSLLPTPFPQNIPLPTLPTSLPTTPTLAPTKPPQLLPLQQQQLEQQLLQLQQQQQQQQTVMNPPPFVLNESQRHTLQNLILRQQQEAQQLAQQSSLQFPQLQLTPQQQDHLLQVLSQQHTFTTQQLQQAHQAIKQQQQQQQQQQEQFVVTSQQQQQQQQTLLHHTVGLSPHFSPGLFNPQQQQQLLQQQQQAQLFQQQLQHIQPPSSVPLPKAGAQRKAKALLPTAKALLPTPQLTNPDPSGLLGIDTVTPPPSTPLTPNPSPASPESISPLYAAIDLDAQTESNHDTALTLACAGGHSELVTLLLSKGADIEHRDKKGFTPLILAATAGHVDVVGILLDHGSEIEAQSERTKDTPLSLACSGGRYEVVELLLSRSANKEHRNVSDYTPLSLAASGGFVTIIKLLLSHGAEINSRTGSKLGISPLMLAAMNGHTAAVKLLLDMGSDINAQIETNRNTALTLACFQGRHEVVSLLVDRRANIEHRAKTGLTPLMEAASGGYVEVGRVLLDKGADVNAPPVPSSRDTALTIAADKGHYRFVELLLSRHAAVDVKNKKGNSPLWLACHGGHLDVVQLLVTAGADIDSQDNRKVSCLMAAFRKGHIKVVKWMVKHVSQFPSDTELSRYIATITDKDLQRKCQQCMEIIVLAKDRQAAEANRNASDLLEELDKERQHEEHKKAAAAKKREKKKKKKKEKQVTREKEPSTDSKNSSPEPESEDSQPQEKEEKKEEKLVLQPPTATTTSTLGINLPTSEPIYSKAKGRTNNKRMNKAESPVEIIATDKPPQDENRDPKKNKSDSSNLSRTESKKNKRNRRENVKEPDRVPNIERSEPTEPEKSNIEAPPPGKSGRDKESRSKAKAANKKKKQEKEAQLNSTTAISDLDDFGNLPSISDRDIEKLRKTVEKTKINNVEKSHFEKHSSETTTPNMLSVKTPSLVNSPKRGQKKEDGWKEVIRKSKKVQVPASAISRVIGRGGCNINAIREVSGANIDVEKNKGSGDRFITIKGSADATRQAHALITALVTDPDKELVEILPKTKTKQPAENKSLYFIPPIDLTSQPTSASVVSIAQPSKGPSNKSLAPRLQQQAALSAGNVPRSTPQPQQNIPNASMVWGSSPTPGSMSPRRNSTKGSNCASQFPAPVPGMTNGPTVPDKGSVTRQLFSADKRGGFTAQSPVTQTTMSGISMAPRSMPGPADIRPSQQPVRPASAKALVPGTVKLLQRPSSTGPGKQDQMPLPILCQSVTTLSNTTMTVSSASGSLSMSSSGEFSPFDNIFSNTANQFLGKKEDFNERMNFASVAAAGVVPTFSNSASMSPVPHSPDPALQHLAPGFKPSLGPRMMAPPDMIPGFPKNLGFPLPPHMMDLGGMQLSFQLMQQAHNFAAQQSPNASPRSSQSSGAGLSPRSNNSGFEMSSSLGQKMEYATPNQPMTLPKISSSLNPNAPDFAPDFAVRTSSNVSGPGGPPNFQGVPPLNAMFQLYSVKNSMLAQASGNNPPPGAPPSQSPVPMGNSPDPMSNPQFLQNMTGLQQLTLQNQTPGSPGLGQAPGVPGYQGTSVQHPFSPLPVQGRPNSAPSMGVMSKDGPSPTPMGAPRTNSPLPPSTPPMPDMMRVMVEDRRQPLPIGGERQQRKAPGPLLGPGPDFGDTFWPNQLNDSIDWNTGKLPMSSASLQTSVISTSVIAGSNMSTNLCAGGDSRVLHMDNHQSSNSSMEDLSDQNFSHYVQGSGLPTLFNGGPYPGQVFGGSPMVGVGDGGGSAWGNAEHLTSDDLHDSGVWKWSK